MIFQLNPRSMLLIKFGLYIYIRLQIHNQHLLDHFQRTQKADSWYALSSYLPDEGRAKKNIYALCEKCAYKMVHSFNVVIILGVLAIFMHRHTSFITTLSSKM